MLILTFAVHISFWNILSLLLCGSVATYREQSGPKQMKKQIQFLNDKQNVKISNFVKALNVYSLQTTMCTPVYVCVWIKRKCIEMLFLNRVNAENACINEMCASLCHNQNVIRHSSDSTSQPTTFQSSSFVVNHKKKLHVEDLLLLPLCFLFRKFLCNFDVCNSMICL